MPSSIVKGNAAYHSRMAQSSNSRRIYGYMAAPQGICNAKVQPVAKSQNPFEMEKEGRTLHDLHSCGLQAKTDAGDLFTCSLRQSLRHVLMYATRFLKAQTGHILVLSRALDYCSRNMRVMLCSSTLRTHNPGIASLGSQM